MTAYPLPNRFDDDDESPTLRMRTLVLERPSRASRPSQESGFWPRHEPVPAPQPIDALDPALRAMSDPNAVFATWQDEAMTSAAASMVVRAASVATPLSRPAAPARAASPPPVGATLSPDGTLLPWREAPPASSRGSILIALAVLLTGAGAAAVGYTRAATTGPATVEARVTHAPEHAARGFVLIDDATEKRAPAASAAPERPRPRPRRARVTPPASSASPASPAPAADAPAPPSGDPTDS